MERNYIKIETCTCPYCGCMQTAFIYAFDENNEIIKKENAGEIPSIGFHCVWNDCQYVVKDEMYYAGSGMIVGSKKSKWIL